MTLGTSSTARTNARTAKAPDLILTPARRYVRLLLLPVCWQSRVQWRRRRCQLPIHGVNDTRIPTYHHVLVRCAPTSLALLQACKLALHISELLLRHRPVHGHRHRLCVTLSFLPLPTRREYSREDYCLGFGKRGSTSCSGVFGNDALTSGARSPCQTYCLLYIVLAVRVLILYNDY